MVIAGRFVSAVMCRQMPGRSLKNASWPVIASEAIETIFPPESTPFTHVEAWFLNCVVALLLAMKVS
jgi:hypothetical protein